MSIQVNPENIFEYFEMFVCPIRAQNLHRKFIAAVLHHLSLPYREHMQDYEWFCFQCQILRLLCETLIFRGCANIIFVSGRYEMNIFGVSFASFFFSILTKKT